MEQNANNRVEDVNRLISRLAAEKKKVITALKEGFMPQRTGFVLMPSSCPYGRHLPSLTLNNYQRMVELAEKF